MRAKRYTSFQSEGSVDETTQQSKRVRSATALNVLSLSLDICVCGSGKDWVSVASASQV